MRRIALWMTYLYFFICPLEFILNNFFGSSVKYVALGVTAFMLMYFIGTPKQNIKFGSFQVCILLWATFEAASYLWTMETGSTSRVLTAYILMAVLVFATNIIVEVVKGLFPKIPTNIVAVIVALIVTILAMVILCAVFKITVMWYYAVGAVVLGIFVGYAAMYGFDKFKEAFEKLKTNK